MIGVKNLDGMLGTDIFCNEGLLCAAAARLGETAVMTVVGLIIGPLVFLDKLCPTKADMLVSYCPGPGDSYFFILI